MNWKGVFPALTTPFNENDDLDLSMLEKSVQSQIDAGVHGLILGGTLGEASTLRFEEKEKLVKKTKEITGEAFPVILNIAEGSLHEALNQVKESEKWGVNGYMLLPPMRYKADARETVTYFKEIAKSTSLPFMIYNNPVDYKIEVTLEMFEELASLKNIESVKESTRDITNITRMKNAFGDRFQILCGVDTLALESLALGADGWVAGLVCAFPKETMAIYHYFHQGEWTRALEIYRWFLPLLELDLHPKLVQYIKLAASVEGIGSEHVRAPRLKLEGDEKKHVLQIINKALQNRPDLSTPNFQS